MRSTIVLAAGFAAGLAVPVFAGEPPSYDRRIEEAAIARVQQKLPELRSAYGLRDEALTLERQKAPERVGIATLAGENGIKSYPGRIRWL